MIVVHVIAMIEVAPVIAMIVVALEISEDPEMTVDLEMIVVLVTGMIEEVIEVVTIGVLVHLEEEIGAEPVMLLEEMIVVEVDSVEEAIEIEVMIGAVIVEMILHRSRLPNVNKVVRKPPKVEMVG